MKKVLFFGGSGRVGTLVLPYLAAKLEAHVFDLRGPRAANVTFHQGTITDADAIARAVTGMDAVVYMVMVPEQVLNDVPLSYDINLKGVHLVMQAAHDAGIRRAVYCSTGSVYDKMFFQGLPIHDDMIPDSQSVYGMTKAMGEHVCEWFCRYFEMTILALRLWRPVTYEAWDQTHRGAHGDYSASKAFTLDRDLARAIDAALQAPLTGFHAMSISGDHEQQVVDISRARNLLGWTPTPWPAPVDLQPV